jgi:hypothetical protein
MSRVVPPWTYTAHHGKNVVMLGNTEYRVDPDVPPVFFFATYLGERIPRSWVDAQRALQANDRHPLFERLVEFHTFLAKFESRGNQGEYKDILNWQARAMIILGYDMYSLEGNRSLQDSLVQRLIGEESFQGSMHELGVAATMMRAGFDIEFEDETDSSRKHPEFVATHRNTRTRVAVEAKSIHRTGVLGFKKGTLPPTVETADARKIAAQVCRQVKRALPKAGNLPLYIFVDLNLPPAVAEQFGLAWIDECKTILPQIDTGFDENGVKVGKIMNFLTVTNRPMHLGRREASGRRYAYRVFQYREGGMSIPGRRPSR